MDLAPRELEVLTAIAEGLTDRQIAEVQIRQPGTIKTQAKFALQKLGASNRAHAVAIGFRRGILS